MIDSGSDNTLKFFTHVFDGLGPCYIAEPSGAIVYVNRRLQDLLEEHHESLPTRLASHLVRRALSQEGLVRSNLLLRPAADRDEGRSFRLIHRRLGEAGANDVLILTTFEETTKELQALQGLQRAKERSEDLLGIVSDWVWEVDADWRITFAATRDEGILGRPTESLGGTDFFELGAFEVNPEQPQRRVVQRRQRASFRDALFRARRPDGRERLLVASAIPVFDEQDGAFRGFRGAASDVTERIVAERAASQYRQQLEQALKELSQRNVELTKAVEEARQAASARSDFLAMISHELRTPLNAVIGFSELMATEAFGPLGHENYRGYIGDILNSARLLLSLINEILDFIKLDARQMTFDFQVVDLREMVVTSVRFVSEQARAKGIAVSIEVPAGVLVRADSKRLRQLLLNLLSNAVKFTPEGGHVDVSAADDAPTGDGRQRVALSISDTGIGIAPEHIGLVFEPFKQVDGALSRKYEGTGLGLPLARLIAEGHGGVLHLSSVLGEGTRVTVDLEKVTVLG